MSEERLSFQAEVSRLLDIVANSLYSNKEIFLRELISNASDACDRLRYAALTQPDLAGGDAGYRVELRVDPKAHTLTVEDNGIGMNRDDLVDNLGTIARSGTAAFVNEIDAKADGASLIGQFGVGFYSTFMVAERVEVASRKAGEAAGWRWVSQGHGTFSVAEADDAPARGTRVVLHLKKSERAFLDPARLRGIVKTYSDHIAIPVVLVEDDKTETLNAASALWMRPKAEVSDAQYKEFYHHVAHAFDDPWLRLHFKVEGKIEYAGLLFVPTVAPFDLYHPERRHGVKLYVKRVFITDDCADLVPPYLRFLRGVIDTEDLPLNISRELLQHNPLLARIREAVAKRVLGELKKKADKAPEEYAGFWNAFGPVLKEGLYEDDARRAELLGLARFASTRAEGLISLADYVTRMHEGQDAIYYISGDSAEALRQSPQIEGFAAKGVEVLLLTDPVDEFWVPAVMEYEGKPLRSVTRGGVDLDKIAGMAGADSEAVTDGAETPPLAASEAGMDALVAYVRLALKDEVKDVRPSQRLTDSAVCLVADEGDMDMHLERLLKQHRQVDQAAKRILEINPRHSLIRRLAAALEEDGAGAPGAALEDVPWLLLDQARILEGEPLPDPAGFAKRLSAVVERGFPLGG